MTEKSILDIMVLRGIEKSEGCPLCFLHLEHEQRYMDYLLTNEMTMNPRFRERVSAAKGFCNHHMHLLYKIAQEGCTEDGSGYALYMQTVIQRIIEQLEALPLDHLRNVENATESNIFTRRRRRRQALSELHNDTIRVIQGQQLCPACRTLWSSDETFIDTLVMMLDDKEFREGFKSSRGLCLPHLASAIKTISRIKLKNSADVAQVLIESETRYMQLVARYLSDYVRKRNWQFRHEAPGPEVNANRMSLDVLAGVEGLYCRSYRAFSPLESDDRKGGV